MNGQSPVDIRDAFFGEVVEAALRDPKIIILADDQGAMMLNTLRVERPHQYINCGIAEQNIANVAAGLALGGMRPVVYGITNFVSLRCCEQLSAVISAMSLPVTVVASGAGLTYAADGPTHHATQDLAILQTMPNFTIFNPGDAVTTSAAARFAMTSKGPCYVRLERGVLPDLAGEWNDFEGGMRLLLQGEDVLLISTGILNHTALQVAMTLNSEGICTGVLDLFRLKPVNEERLEAIMADYGCVVIIEEQTPVGGLGSIVSELMAKNELRLRYKRISLPEAPCYFYGTREWLHQRFGLDAVSITSTVKNWLGVACASR